jgi:hypothetical protein
MTMLVLAVHTVAQTTAKVPFAVILLQDLINSKKLPPGIKCRMVSDRAHAWPWITSSSEFGGPVDRFSNAPPCAAVSPSRFCRSSSRAVAYRALLTPAPGA